MRIAVNTELDNLKEAIPAAIDLLEGGGKLVIVTFHSLEQSIVVKLLKEAVKAGKGQVLTKDALKPTEIEINSNPKSRSALLNVFEKLI